MNFSTAEEQDEHLLPLKSEWEPLLLPSVAVAVAVAAEPVTGGSVAVPGKNREL